MAHRLIAGLAALALAFAARAQEGLPDPTRPPAALAAPAAQDAPASGEPQLQSVILPRAGKPAAIISGERVELGGRLGEWRLLRVSETEVVLAGPAGRQTLSMTPGVHKRPAAAAPAGEKR